jgi:SPP1 family predicted phage head-tail adaptor
MRAGNLDRVIQLQRIATVTTDSYGAKSPSWTTFATLRAQKLSNAIIDREGARGDSTDNTITFRSRWLYGVTLECRVTYEGQQYKIMGLTELGRRVGLDITCERVGP